MGMTLVDCKGDNAPWFIKHASWDGLTPADLIFPSFIFILGMAVPLALSKNKPIRPKAIIRIFALFAIGLFLNLVDEKF